MVRGHTLAVAVLLLFSGCQGFDSGGGGETVTPAPVPTVDGATPGDATDIADRHRRALTDRSYTTTVALTVEYENGTTASLVDEFAVGPDDAYRYDRQVREPYPQAVTNFTIWQTRPTEFRRVSAANGTTTVTVSDSTGFDDITLSGFLRRVLMGFDVTTEQDDGRTLVDGRQTGPLTVPLPADLRRGRNGTLDGEIHDGAVRTITVRAQADDADSGRPVTVRMRFTVRRVGETGPTRPAWATESNAGG
jgi:hypothetical protein